MVCWIKKLILSALLLCGFNSLLFSMDAPQEAPAVAPNTFKRVIVILDLLDTPENSGLATTFFVSALFQKTAPIIVSGTVVKALLAASDNFSDTLENNPLFATLHDAVKKQDVQTVKRINAENAALVANYKMRLQVRRAQQKIVVNQDLWDVYQDAQQDFFIFIPRSMAPEYVIAFALNSAAMLQKKDIKSIQVDGIGNKTNLINLEAFKKLFIPGSGPWLLYLFGHGFAFNKEPLVVSASPFSGAGAQKSVAAKVAHQIKNPLEESTIANLTLDQFRDFLSFLNTTLSTKFLYYISCFSGDYHLFLPYVSLLEHEQNAVLKSLPELNYIIVSGALASQPSFTWYAFNYLLKEEQEVFEKAIPTAPISSDEYAAIPRMKIKRSDNAVDFKNFFSALEGHFLGKKEWNGKDAFKKILTFVNGNPGNQMDPFGLGNIPLIKFPRVSYFRPVSLSDDILVIADVLPAARQLHVARDEEKKRTMVAALQPIIAKDTSSILLYPTELVSPLIIELEHNNYPPALVSMAMGTGVHFIETIDTRMNGRPVPLDFFLKGSFVEFAPTYPKYYFIKQLRVANYSRSGLPATSGGLALYDVLIKRSDTELIVTFKLVLKNTVYIYRFAHTSQERFNKAHAVGFSTPIAFDLIRELPLGRGMQETINGKLSLYHLALQVLVKHTLLSAQETTALLAELALRDLYTNSVGLVERLIVPKNSFKKPLLTVDADEVYEIVKANPHLKEVLIPLLRKNGYLSQEQEAEIQEALN